MSILLSIVISTANILGIFNDPFEFEGDYGSEVNPTRKQVFELVVSPEALAKNLSDVEIKDLMKKSNATEKEIHDYRNFLEKKAIIKEIEYGPTLSQLITPELINNIKNKQNELRNRGFTDSDLEKILNFIDRYKDQKIFHFLRNNPPELLSLDKSLRDQAAREGRAFDLPILGSTKALEGKNSLQLKNNLLDAVFKEETLALTKPRNSIQQSLGKLKKNYLREFFGETANNSDLETFESPAGQLFFYWMYQALNLHLISVNPELIEQVNKVKDIFAHTLGDPINRANTFRDKLIASDSGVVFVQESDAFVHQALVKENLFLPIDCQNQNDGTLIFLRSDLWEPNYSVIPIENYDGYKAGRINLILAKRKGSGEQFLLASCHGHSTRSEDGRLQISLIMEKFDQLSDGNLQLLIGIDANTKTEQDVILFRAHLDSLGLVSTQTGPTTIKKRMVTAQHSKAGKLAIDEEDYLITLKAENGSRLKFTNILVGFKKENSDTSKTLPNIDNPSDHYPVSASAAPIINNK